MTFSQILLHSLEDLGKSLSLPFDHFGFVKGTWCLQYFFVPHYNVLEAAILGKFSCMCSHPHGWDSMCPGQQ